MRPIGRFVRRGTAAVACACIRAAAAWRTNARPAVAMGVLLVGMLACSPAGATTFEWFTDQSLFEGSLTAGFYNNDLSSLTNPEGGLANPLPFSGGLSAYSYAFEAPGGLYAATGVGLTPSVSGTTLTFTTSTTSPTITAFGGIFSITGSEEQRIAGTISLNLFTGTLGGYTSISGTTVPVLSGTSTFLGLITYPLGAAPITMVALSGSATGDFYYPTAERVIVGVPEPSTVAALLTAATFLVCGFRLRKAARRRLSIGIATAIVGMQIVTLAAEPLRPTPSPIERAAGLRSNKKYEEALEELRQATRAVKQAQGDDAAELLPIYELATEILIDTDAVEKAAGLLEKSLALHGKIRESDGSSGVPVAELTASHARAILLEGRLHTLNGRLLPAVHSAARAARMVDATGGARSADLPRAVAQLDDAVVAVADLLGPGHESALEAGLVAAETLESLGRCREAAARRATRLAALRESTDPVDAEVLAESCRVARLWMAAGQATETVPDLEAALAACAGETQGLAAAVRTLGDLQLAAEQFTEAQQAYLRAADIDAAAAGAAHFTTLYDKLLAAMVAFESGRGPAPLAELDALIAAFPAKISGSDPAAPVLIEGLRRSAEIALVVGRPAQAKDLGKRGLALAKACQQLAPPERIAMAVAAARPLFATGEQPAARAALERIVRDADQTLGPSHPQTQAAVVAFAECLASTTPADARPLVDRLLASGAASPRNDLDERLVRLFEAVGAAQGGDPSGPAEAAWGKDLLRLRREQWGAEHSRVATTCLTLAGGRLAAGDIEEALGLCRQAIKLQEQTLGNDHPEVAASLLVTGDALRRQGKLDEAAAACERSLAIWEAKAGPEHRATLAAVRGLAGVRLAQKRGAEALPLLERLLAADSHATDSHGTTSQPAHRARLLVRLAGVLAATDAAERSRRCLDEVLELPCFRPTDAMADPTLRDLALTMAEAARVLATLDDPDAATTAIRTARGLAIRMEVPRDTLTMVDAIAAGTAPLPLGRL